MDQQLLDLVRNRRPIKIHRWQIRPHLTTILVTVRQLPTTAKWLSMRHSTTIIHHIPRRLLYRQVQTRHWLERTKRQPIALCKMPMQLPISSRASKRLVCPISVQKMLHTKKTFFLRKPLLFEYKTCYAYFSFTCHSIA